MKVRPIAAPEICVADYLCSSGSKPSGGLTGRNLEGSRAPKRAMLIPTFADPKVSRFATGIYPRLPNPDRWAAALAPAERRKCRVRVQAGSGRAHRHGDVGRCRRGEQPSATEARMQPTVSLSFTSGRRARDNFAG